MPAPPGDGTRSDGPALANLDLAAFWTRFQGAAPPLLRLGLRASVWLLTLGPPVLIGRWRPFHRLPAADQDRLLVRLLDHPAYLARQLALVLKLVASFAWFQDEGTREWVDGGTG